MLKSDRDCESRNGSAGDRMTKKGGHHMEQQYHILVVEDDKEIREGVEIYLKNQG